MKSRLDKCRNQEGDRAVPFTSVFLNGAAAALARRERLTLRNTQTSESTIRRRAEWARELPNTGYALEVDGLLKTEFETKEGAWTGAEELEKRFPMLRVKICDAETKTTEESQLPSS
jgi:hypothetical protein